MKKIILTLLCLFVALTVVACGNDTAETKGSATKAGTEKTTEEKTSEEKTSNVETEAPTESPTEVPTEEPTEPKAEEPTEAPTEEPTEPKTEEATESSTEKPTEQPTEQQTEEPVVRPTDGPEISGEPYTHGMTYYYKNYEEFRDSFLNFPEYDLQDIAEFEKEYLYSLCKNSYVSDDEIRNGIFGNFRKNILESDRIMIPFVDGEISFKNYPGNQSIVLHSLYENGTFETSYKPIILYGTKNRIAICTTYINKSLIEDALKKGPSWLISVLDPNTININNLSKEASAYISVYEKDCLLGDRTVSAMVIEDMFGRDEPYCYVSFLYDDVFVCVRGKKAAVEEVLPTLTFYECQFSTGKPLRDTPGRTAEYLAVK